MKIAIVGAGISGLAVGYWLQRENYEIVVYETSSVPGGRTRTERRPNSEDIVDVGTQYFHSNYKRTLSLVREFGLEAEIQKVRGKTRFFDDRVNTGSFVTGHRVPYISAGSFWDNLKMSMSGLWMLLKHPIDPYAVLKTPKIDSLCAGKVIKNQFDWEFNVRALMTAGALIEPDPKDVSLLHVIRLMRIIVMTDYLTLNGGLSTLHEKMARQLNVEYNTRVAGILESNQKVVGLKLESGEIIDADKVVIATPPSSAADLLPADWSDEKSFLTQIEHPSAIIVTLFLTQPLENDVWSYVFRPSERNLVSFCVDASNKNSNMVPSGKAALQAWICHPASQQAFNQTDQQLVQSVIKELSKELVDIGQAVESSHVHRVSNAIPQMSIGHNKRTNTFLDLMDRRSGVELCGDYFSGGYVECALWSVERAVNNIKRSNLAKS